jgi:DNA helicase HerA-like ATPase
MTGTEAGKLFIGAGAKPAYLTLRLANRHGLIAGATGTGKTVTLQILAEGFAAAGVPVFLADVKGDLSGMCAEGAANPKLAERAKAIGLDGYKPQRAPVIFWDLFGEKGHPIRTTISEMGPLLLSRLLGLSDAQEGTLSIVFQLADDEGLLLLDLKDLRALLQYASEQRERLSARYGNVNAASVGAIQRSLLTLEQEGGAHFFGEPALDLRDFMRADFDGRAFVNILAADRLMMSPRLYATFLLWLLSELFEEMPEVGDPEKPRLVFFFDEAHLLFEDAPKALVDKVEQVVRLIRSKGVGVYFISQNPLDIPEDVLGQLGNRVQHALRAFTPRDQKVIKATAETFRRNPKLDAETALTQLGVGEALVSTLEDKGAPSVVERVLIRPPCSRIGPASEAERRAVIDASPVRGRYDTPVDRASAHEMLLERAEKAVRDAPPPSRPAPSAPDQPRRPSNRLTTTEVVMREVGRTLGREIIRGILGSIFKGRR